ncbi:MAG: TRAP transporter small permease [Gammaproteobacteria bacterium]
MRAGLDRLYLWSGYIAAACLVSIALTIVAQILGRFVGVAVDSTESAGFFLAGGTFFGLAHTFKQGEHIRVTLLTRLASGKLARIFDLWAIGFCAIGVAYLSFWAFDLVYDSYVFGDVSPGLLAMPFWIPRSTVAAGTLIFCVALIDEFVRVARGTIPSYVANATPVYEADASVTTRAGSDE